MAGSATPTAGCATSPDQGTTVGMLIGQATAAAEAGGLTELTGGIQGGSHDCTTRTGRSTPERATITLRDWDCSCIQLEAKASAAVYQAEQTALCSSRGIQGITMISKLVGLMQDEDAGVRVQAAHALRTLGRSISSKARISAELALSPATIVQSEVLLVGSMNLQALVQLCLADDAAGAVKLSAAAELCRRAGTEEGQAAVAADAVLQAAVVQGMVAMLHDSVAALRKHAAGVVCGLCTRHAEHQQLVVREPGAITALVQLLKDEVPGVTQQVLSALSALAKDNERNQMQIVRAAGAVQALYIYMLPFMP